jgi:hypothetical protein
MTRNLKILQYVVFESLIGFLRGQSYGCSELLYTFVGLK